MRMGTGVNREVQSRFDLLKEERFASGEGARRQRSILIIGGLMVLGMLLPDVQASRGGVKYGYNIYEVLVASGVPPGLKYLVLHPLLAGLVCLAMFWKVRERVRGGILAFVALLPLVIAMSDSDAREGLRMMLSGGMGVAEARVFLTVFMLGFGLLGLFVGLRSRWYRPGSMPACAIAILGGALFVLAILMPILPGEGGYVMLAAPFMLLKESASAWIGFTMLLWMIGSVTASVMAFTLLPALHAKVVRIRANRGYWFLVCGIMIFIFGLITFSLYMMTQFRGGPGAMQATIFGLLKGGLMGTGLALMLPFGLIDLVIGDAPAPIRPGQDGPGAARPVGPVPVSPAMPTGPANRPANPFGPAPAPPAATPNPHQAPPPPPPPPPPRPPQ
jgi:hypothetical protein